MHTRFLKLVLAASIVSLAGCSSNVRLDSDIQASYQYRGEKYGKVVTTMADSVASDVDKATRFQQLGLEQAIIGRLKARLG